MLSIKDQYEIGIASLLHDIGKFKQRAFGGNETESISKEVLSMEGQLLPVFEQRYSYRHALWTYDFFINDLFPLVKDRSWDIALDWEKIARESASHHNPSEGFSRFVSRADRLSAGIDRYTGDVVTESSNIPSEKYRYLKTPLRALFSSINNGSRTATPTMSRYSYKLSKVEDATAPAIDADCDEMLNDYQELWKQFISDLGEIKNLSSVMQLLSKLKDLMLEYTWCIPSATNDFLNDISLYDHSITTMALAIALSCSENREKPFRLFAADISGIQSFIFQSSKDSFPNAAKVFRGRSFIVSAVSTACRLEISDVIGLIPFTDIIDAGGKFTLILPDSDGLEERLDRMQEEQETYFLHEHLGTLSVLADYSMCVSPNALSMEYDEQTGRTNFSRTQIELSRRLNARKTRKFSHVDLHGKWVLDDVNMAGGRCAACGIRTADDGEFCTTCRSEIDLGARIPDSRFVSFEKDSGEGSRITKNYSVVLSDRSRSDRLCYSLKTVEDSLPLWRLNTYTPDKDFTEIAEGAVSDDGKGKPFLAYVKLDVDNLGEIFIDGLPSKLYSISRYVALSRLFHNFFNVNVREMLRNSYEDAYTVISGGDDVFIILPWNKAVGLVSDLNNQFKTYCCENPSIHFSAGIVVTGATTPFALVNRKTNEALDDGAKKREGKNCVEYFGQLFSFDELNQLKDDSADMAGFLDDD
ncbi:MAG: type III-A CRISPR-associated protein Cas10/Csm1, partial [Candidatus Cloacimonetes bacterium]|nr:type III-A CRISPR-associated protein Cas10/Csm1 [Candidatus Cloacimonadota bacterium]